jgi:hypothetical protein
MTERRGVRSASWAMDRIMRLRWMIGLKVRGGLSQPSQSRLRILGTTETEKEGGG